MSTNSLPSNDNSVSQLFPNQSNWRDISANYKHAVGVDDKGRPWSWGTNDHGQLGLGDTRTSISTPGRIGTFSKIRSVASGQFHTLLVDEPGNLWGAGWSKFGALGNGQVGNEAQSNYLTLVEVSNAAFGVPWTEVQSKGFLSMGMQENGSLWLWGKNDKGAVGNGSTSDQAIPVKIIGPNGKWVRASVGWDLAAAIDTNDDLYIWGDNSAGQCSMTPLATLGAVTTPQKVQFNGFKWQQVSVGRTHVLAVERDQGGLWTWGLGSGGQLGLGSNVLSVRGSAALVTFPQPYSKLLRIFAGDLVSGAITQSANGGTQVWIWGTDSLGQVSGVTPGKGFVYTPTRPIGSEESNDWFDLALGVDFALSLRSGD